MRALQIIGVMFLLMCIYATATAGFTQEIIIGNDGMADITGNAELDLLTLVKPISGELEGNTPELTSKQGAEWKFAYDSKGFVVDSYDVQVQLPRDAVIHNISTGTGYTVELGSRPVLHFVGEDVPMDIVIKYVVPGSDSSFQETAKTVLPIGLLLLVMLFAVGLFAVKRLEKRPGIDHVKLKTLKLAMNDSQIKIIDALLDQGGECSQTKIRYLTNLPKASLSRNIEHLAQKEIISKFYNGTSNYVKIHPSLRQVP